MQAGMKTTIYGLCDPRTGQLRYVGKTKGKMERRVRGHLSEARKGQPGHKNNWVRQLQVLSLAPEAFVIEEVSADWKEAEMHNIAYFRSLGCDLTNGTDGGDGQSPGWVPGPEFRAKMSVAHKGKPKTAEHRARLSAARQKQGPVAASVRAKISRTLTGRVLGPQSEETRAKNSAAHMGKTHSPESRAAMRAAWERRKLRAAR